MSAVIRHALFDAIGATPLRLRQRSIVVSTPNSTETEAAMRALVVICEVGECGAARSVLRALGIDVDTVMWLSPDTKGMFAVPPVAANYLVLGESLSRTFGAELPTAQQQTARIVVAAAPAQWRGATAKRQLWQSLKPIVRALRGG